MARTYTNLTDNLKRLIDNLNEVSFALGDTSLLGTGADSDVVQAINGLDSELGNNDISSIAGTVKAALVQLHNEIGDSSISSISLLNNTIKGSLVQLHNEIGDSDISSIGSNINNALRKLDSDLRYLDSSTVGSLSDLDSTITSKNSIVNAINSINADVIQLFDSSGALDARIGSLSNLSSFYDSSGNRDNVVAALNHVGKRIIDVYDSAGILLNT